MNKINIIQFLPYFPPHAWWLETVAREFSSFYVAKWYGEVVNVIFSVWQDEWIKEYNKNWYKVYVLPAFDIISNFPVPKFWKKDFWEVLRIIKTSHLAPLLTCEGNRKWIIQTHTRFFLSSFLWWLFAKYHKLKWVHIEHGSDYVKSSSKLVEKISYFYDKIIWKWIFSKADKILAISEWVRNFIEKEFVKDKDIKVIYNWIDFIPAEKQENKDIIKIGFVWRLVKLKWVDLLIEAFKNLSKKYENIILEIVWDGEEKTYLESIKSDKIKFLWRQNREEVASFLANCDILVNPSFQEWLPTTVLEWLLSKCVLVATDVGWTSEISNLEDLILVASWDLEDLEKWLEIAILNYKELRWKSSELVKEKFDWNESVGKYFNLYNNL